MADTIYLILRVGFLALLWFFIFAALFIMKKDLRTAEIATRKMSSKNEIPATASRFSTATKNAISPSAIKIISENNEPRSIPLLSSPFTVGRAKAADITITDNFASSNHARFYYNNGRWFIEDTGSTNGTFINNERLTTPVQITIGTKITIGRTTLEII